MDGHLIRNEKMGNLTTSSIGPKLTRLDISFNFWVTICSNKFSLDIMVSIPMVSLVNMTNPDRMDSMIAGVPPSSRSSTFETYL